MTKATIKTEKELTIMRIGGQKLGEVKHHLRKLIKEGISAYEVEQRAVELIKKTGGSPSFMAVPEYHWATCVNVNKGLVHGIPTKEVVFQIGDVVSVDVGLYYQGFHTDTSFSMAIKPDDKITRFLSVGEKALGGAIKSAVVGNKISDISEAIQKTVVKAGYSPIRALGGHGVGRVLHEEPMIPCFKTGGRDVLIKPGMALAIEVMYTQGSPEVVMENDGWTISMRDGKIAALYEETVAVYADGPVVLTEG